MDKHLLHSGDPHFEDYYATVCSTLLLLTERNTVYLFERVYDHNHLRPINEEEKLAEDLILDFHNYDIR